MIKKVKRWYTNLLPYQKDELFSFCLAILISVLLIVIDLFCYLNDSFYEQSNTLIGFLLDCFFIFICILCVIYYPLTYFVFHTFDRKKHYIMYGESEKKVKDYFHQSGTNIIEILPKEDSKISGIIEYYKENYKEKIIESYWAELDEFDENDEQFVCYISVIFKGENDRIIYPGYIVNANYLIQNFTFKI